MIVGEQKPFDEIWEMVKDHKQLTVFGCNTCVAVCHQGGNKEAGNPCLSPAHAGDTGRTLILKLKTVVLSGNANIRFLNRQGTASRDPRRFSVWPVASACSLWLKSTEHSGLSGIQYDLSGRCQRQWTFHRKMSGLRRLRTWRYRRRLSGQSLLQASFQRAVWWLFEWEM